MRVTGSGAGPAHPHPPVSAVRAAVTRALADDLGVLGDLTSALLPPDAHASAAIVSRAEGVLAGRLAGDEAFHQIDPSITVDWLADDGHRLAPGTVVARVSGSLAPVLTAERTVLNFLCHLSGIASLTARYVSAAATGAGHAVIRDTRKTTPGLAALEKAAVRAGGGVNHRGTLSDGILLKDNHLAGLTITEAVERARALWPGGAVQVECDGDDQLREALAAGAEAVLLDNYQPEGVSEAVVAVRASGLPCLVEVSGGVTLDNVAGYAAAGADLIAVGAITHSAPALDLGLDLAPDA